MSGPGPDSDDAANTKPDSPITDAAATHSPEHECRCSTRPRVDSAVPIGFAIIATDRVANIETPGARLCQRRARDTARPQFFRACEGHRRPEWHASPFSPSGIAKALLRYAGSLSHGAAGRSSGEAVVRGLRRGRRRWAGWLLPGQGRSSGGNPLIQQNSCESWTSRSRCGRCRARHEFPSHPRRSACRPRPRPGNPPTGTSRAPSGFVARW
ncbi:hypothetical protein NS506_02724 [Nocardia seriolae]|uniref:Uncharacterized protein n=1 Tax=Nocardia seriolae TaxID=37332 RepID=A0ABC8ARI7_9NOCA|nr:hypothetical protein NS506_02724 [Nocardia seriolae]